MPVFTMDSTPLKPRPAPGQQGSTPFRSASASRFRSSLVPMGKSTPARASRLTGKLAPTNGSHSRDLFRTSTPQTVRTTKFAPSLPADATKMTPSARKFTQKSSSGGMTGIASTELFKMRIPSPDPALSGEAMSKEVPDDPSRKGTIYADQFLAHKCPQDFDDLQRRQFFCILDLRRLKYAADEIFAKKDWKLNIMNFAKEYEKSRSLIMLRYGLYEFKNIKPSEAVLKKWRAAHNLPDPEPQAETPAKGLSAQNNRRLTGASILSTKRKAEDEVAPKDNALMTSTANQNKRRNIFQEQADPALTGPAPFKKSKRKADDTEEPDENQPNKVQKPTPSAAKSKFESILNRSQSGSTSPVKRAPLSSFGTPSKPSESQASSFTSKSNPFTSLSNGFKPASAEAVKEDSSTGSVLAGHNAGSASAKSGGNIFSYLSESSANSSGNENGNADEGDTESESEEEGGSQEVPPSDQPSAVASAGTSTPSTRSDSTPFAAEKPSSTFGIFGQANKEPEASANSKGGLFGRVQMGSNGQPLRAATNAGAEAEQTPAKRPGDYTFNAATTPISFTPVTASKPESVDEPGKAQGASTAKTPAALFGAGAPSSSAFQPTTTNLFGSKAASTLPQTKTDNTAASLFANQKPTSTHSDLFGSNQTANAIESPATKKRQMDASDTADTASEATPSALKATTLFGASAASTTPKAPTTSLFGSSKPTESQTNGNTNSQSLFGNSGNASGSNLFGASPGLAAAFGTESAKPNGSSTSLFETPSKPSASFSFGASKPEATNDTPKPSNGPSQASSSFEATTPKPIFGSDGFKPTTPATSSLFGNNSTTPATSTLFGAKTTETKPAEKKPATTAMPPLFANKSTNSTILFGNDSGAAAPVEKKDEPMTTQPESSFGSTSSAAPSFVFGAQSAAPTGSSTPASSAPSIFFGGGANGTQANGGGPKKPDFSFGSTTTGTDTTPFTFSQGAGASSSNVGFTFSAGGNGQSFNNPFASPTPSPAASMFVNKPSTPGPAPAPSSSFNFSFGQQAPSTPNAAPSSQGMSFFGASSTNGAPSFSFTQATPTQNNANPFAPKPMGTGSFLQASGDASTGANSPFPAPSSIGTTPVNGTPEPQTQEDGEEAPQEQLSLTDGGPGEEDEIILHEVRAKAIKFVPPGKGGQEEEENKSPWSTQGVGPLRVLKNKSTGTVRVLLRAEPRGHIAMNKALLADIEYKSKEKTVNFVAASDDGRELETWVLQVKKPESAQELVRMLEANKSANKK